MNAQIIAVIFQEGGKLLSEIIRNRPPRRKEAIEKPPQVMFDEEPLEKPGESKATSVEAGIACLPCINNHFSVCSGLISDEALRMARRHGIGDEEISRVNKCLDQLNAMEREDLAVDKIKALPDWEKDLAIYAQNESASIRHKLENLTSVDDLEDAAVKIKEARTKIGKDYFKGKLARMPKEQKRELAEKTVSKLLEE